MSAIHIPAEKAIIHYLNTKSSASDHPLHGFTWYEGHGEQDMDALPRGIITVAQGGGPLAHAGIYQCALEILLLADLEGISAQQTRANAITALLNADELDALREVVNKPDEGDDERPAEIQGFGLTGLIQNDPFLSEGRDEEKKQHGIKLAWTVWVYLEEVV